MNKFVIGIDCRLAGMRHAGIGRYITQLVSRVTAHDHYHWIIFISKKEQIEELFPKTIPTTVTIVEAPIQHYTLAEQFKLPTIFNQADLDLLHVPHFNLPINYWGKTVVTIHDLLWHEYKGSTVTTLPAWQYWLKYYFYRLTTSAAVAKAIKIFVPSHAVAETLKKYYPNSFKKVAITPEGVGTELRKEAKKRSIIARKKKQLLYVGSLYPHKNIDLVLKALNELNDWQLVIASARSVFQERVKQRVAELGLSEKVVFKEKVSDADLIKLYQQSTILVQPSLSEGFGLTGLEALAFGTPVVASDIAVFREVYGEAAAFFNPQSAASFSTALIEATSAQKAKLIATKQQEILSDDAWDNLANITLTHYQTALQGS